MAFVIETGVGVPSANAYVPTTFVDGYLAERNRSAENGWSTSSLALKQAAVVNGTAYVDFRWGPRVKGLRLRDMADGRQASGTLTLTTLPLVNETVTLGLITYRFVDSLVQTNDVIRGATVTTAVANLAAAITGGGDGSTSHAMTIENIEVEVSAALGVLSVLAAAEGTNGNEIAFSTTITGATATGSGKLTNGLDPGPQGLIFPRRNLIGWDGRFVVGIPPKLKAVVAEYSVRARAGKLAPDLTADATGARVQSKREKVGPIEEATEYANGGMVSMFRDYPEADRLMAEFLTGSGGGVIR